MQVSFNTFRPYTQNYKINNNHQNPKQNIQFTSGYGAEDWEPIDNPNLPLNTNAERWKNIAQGIKMMTIDQYKYSHDIFPKKPKPLYTPEEIKARQESFYDDVETLDEDENLCGYTMEDLGDWPPPSMKKKDEPEKINYLDTLEDIE